MTNEGAVTASSQVWRHLLKHVGAFALGVLGTFLWRRVRLPDYPFVVSLVLWGIVLGIGLRRAFLSCALGIFCGFVLSLTPPFCAEEEIIRMNGDRGAALLVSAIGSLFAVVPGVMIWLLWELLTHVGKMLK